MTPKQNEGYELAKGAMRCVAECLIIGLLLVGGFSGITLKGLLKYGRLIQSNADRVAQEEARMERVRAKWSNDQAKTLR